MILTLDFETRSAVTELGKTGPWPYAEHPSTDVACLAIKVNNSRPVLWVPSHIYRKLPEDCALPMYGDSAVWQTIIGATEIHAHNVQFEQAIWHHIMHRRYGLPDLPVDKLRDTAAVAAMHALPRKLEQACQVMGLAQQKDMEGSKLMLKMCKPRAPRKAEWALLDKRFGGNPKYQGLKAAYVGAGDAKLAAMCLYAARNWSPEMAEMLLWHEDPSDIERLCRYCLQDVEAEYALGQELGSIPMEEMPVFQHDLIVERRGIQVDVPMVQAALSMIKEHERRLLGELDKLTSGTVRSPKQIEAGKNWLASRGVVMYDMTAASVKEALERELPDEGRRFLEIRQSLGKSSTAKYEAALHQTCSDGRLRGFAMYHGAGTGRWAGKGIQLQNLPRGVFDLGKEMSERAFWRAVDIVRKGDLDALVLEFGDPMPVLSSVIRPLLIAAPGCEFLAADFSAIEGRGLAWLAGEEWVLDAYRAYDTFLLDEQGQRIPDGKGGFKRVGPDMYIITASKILGKPVEQITKAERKNPGKPGDLATGYQGGFNALTKFGATVPTESRPQWIIEWMRRELKGNTKAAEVYENWLAQWNGSPPETALSLLGQPPLGWPYPTESELFEIWGRDVVNKWRASRPKTTALWRNLETAALRCTETGETVACGPVVYRKEGRFVTCQLPSGRKLYYPFPQIIDRQMPWGDIRPQFSHMTVDAETKQWVRRFAHGGLLTENITQAVCRDILAQAMLRLEENGFPIVMHVHDEAVGEIRAGTRTLEEFEQIMTVTPPWATGFPISAAGWAGERYKKD